MSKSDAGKKIVPFDRVETYVRHCRRAGLRIAMTNGCFDLLHPGHVACLQEASHYGDCLIVGLNSDRSIQQIKGPERPIVSQRDRAEMLAALECVDCVVIFDQPSVAGLIERVVPDVLAKGGQYAVEEIVGHEVVLQHGGLVLPLAMKGSYSTTSLVEKIHRLSIHERAAA